MLALLEARHQDGAYDANLMAKARIDQLTGRNEELRTQLREVRKMNNKLSSENDRFKHKVKNFSTSHSNVKRFPTIYSFFQLTNLEEDLKEMKESGGGVVQVTQMTLPEGVSPSSSDVINSLNEHLIVTLEELSKKENKLSLMEEQLLKYKSQFSVYRHQIGLLYKDFRDRRDAWESEKKGLIEERENLQGLRESDRLRIEEFKARKQ